MPTTCSAHRCTNRSKSVSNIHFFRFPIRDAERLKGWLNAIGRKRFVQMVEVAYVVIILIVRTFMIIQEEVIN